LKNLRKIDSCFNCKYAFHEKTYDYPELYCTKDAPPRPKSVMELEVFSEEESDNWYEWAQGRMVQVIDICDTWEKHERN
jgi:hypothetical protein